jgi:hypothetical protein
MYDDSNMAIRMFEYSFEAARREQIDIDGIPTLPFPEVRVIYLQGGPKTSEYLPLRLLFPDGKSTLFTVPVIRLEDYGPAELEKRKLLVLIPFTILHIREQARRTTDNTELRKLGIELEELVINVKRILERGVSGGLLTNADYDDILFILRNLTDELYRKGKQLKEAEMIGDDKFWEEAYRQRAENRKYEALEQELVRVQQEKDQEQLRNQALEAELRKYKSIYGPVNSE